MASSYSRNFKKMTVELIKLQGHSTIKTAEEFNVPLNTTHKRNRVFIRIHHDKSIKIYFSFAKKVTAFFNIIRPNQVWTTDITYIKTKEEGWVYLSSIIEFFYCYKSPL